MFVHSHLSSSLLREVASSAIRMFPLKYILATATMASSVTRIITGNSGKCFFKRMEATKQTSKCGSIAEMLTLLISTFSSKYMVSFIKIDVRIFALSVCPHLEFSSAAFYLFTSYFHV